MRFVINSRGEGDRTHFHAWKATLIKNHLAQECAGAELMMHIIFVVNAVMNGCMKVVKMVVGGFHEITQSRSR